jgi:hypothetical protein
MPCTECMHGHTTSSREQNLLVTSRAISCHVFLGHATFAFHAYSHHFAMSCISYGETPRCVWSVEYSRFFCCLERSHNVIFSANRAREKCSHSHQHEVMPACDVELCRSRIISISIDSRTLQSKIPTSTLRQHMPQVNFREGTIRVQRVANSRLH